MGRNKAMQARSDHFAHGVILHTAKIEGGLLQQGRWAGDHLSRFTLLAESKVRIWVMTVG
jgi:hypothetical protein